MPSLFVASAARPRITSLNVSRSSEEFQHEACLHKGSHILRQGPKVLLLAPLEPDEDSGFVEMTVPAGDFIEHAAGKAERPIREAGARLLELLMEHPKIALLLQSALAERQTTSIEFMINQFAQDIPWEILWERQSRFLGMHADRPTFRSIQVAPPATLAPREPDGIVRIAAVLAAADLPPDAHWDAIYRAVRGAGCDYRILALISSDHLMEQIRAAGDPWVQACYVPGTAWELMATIGSAKPQLLYMFCHGVPGVDDCLEIETRVQAKGGVGSSVYRKADQFLPLREQMLIAVLNSCCGAAPTADMDSPAYALVSGGVPAAVGMREKISGQAADAFCQAFFEAVSRCLGKTGLLPDGFASAWGRVMNELRLGLCMTLHDRKLAADLRRSGRSRCSTRGQIPPPLRPPLRSVATARPDQHAAFVEHRSELGSSSTSGTEC